MATSPPPRFTPAASELQPKKPTAVRRTSSVTDEDRENAMKVRKNAFKNNGGMFFNETAFDCPVMTPFKRDRSRGHCSLFLRRLWLSSVGLFHRIRKSLCAVVTAWSDLLRPTL